MPEKSKADELTRDELLYRAGVQDGYQRATAFAIAYQHPNDDDYFPTFLLAIGVGIMLYGLLRPLLTNE